MFGNDIVRLNKDIERIDSNASITEENVDHIINGAEIVPDDNGILHIPYWANRIMFSGYAVGTVETTAQITLLDKNNKNLCRATIANGKQYNAIEGILTLDRINKKCIEQVWNAGFASIPSTTNVLNANSTFFWGTIDYDFSEMHWAPIPDGIDMSNMKYACFA